MMCKSTGEESLWEVRIKGDDTSLISAKQMKVRVKDDTTPLLSAQQYHVNLISLMMKL